MLKKIAQDYTKLLINGNYYIPDANFATVGNYWKDMVSSFPFFRIYYVTDGDAEIMLKDYYQQLIAGKLYLIPAHSLLQRNCNKSFSHYYVHFQTDIVTENLLKICIENKCLNAPAMTQALFQTIIDNMQQENPEQQIAVKSALFLLLSYFLKDCGPSIDTISNYSAALNYIADHIQSPISVSELAAYCGFSVNYFSNEFTKAFKISPKAYILSKKLDYACSLLLSKKYSIKEISGMTGFSDENYFSRLFHKKIGIPPTAFTVSPRL